MKVKLLRKNQVVDLEDERANWLISHGYGEAVGQKVTPEEAAEKDNTPVRRRMVGQPKTD